MDIVSALKSLISKPLPKATKRQLDEYSDKVITLRPSPELRHFLEIRSDNIGGMSVSALCNALLEAYRASDSEKADPDMSTQLAEVKLSSRRVRRLFRLHDYSVVEAVNILEKYSVSLGDYLDDLRLADKLCSRGFADLCENFAVSKDWLIGRSDWVKSALNFDYNVNELISETQQLKEKGQLDYFSPICCTESLDGRRVVYSGHNQPEVNVGIVLVKRPQEGFKHRTFKVYGPTPFDYERTRIQFKAVMMQAYEIVGSGIFEGRRLDQQTMDSIYGKNLLRVKDFVTTSNPWDPECYFGKPTGHSKALEQDELGAVRAKAEALFSKSG